MASGSYYLLSLLEVISITPPNNLLGITCSFFSPEKKTEARKEISQSYQTHNQWSQDLNNACLIQKPCSFFFLFFFPDVGIIDVARKAMLFSPC
jgi:hypothetical protein